jgi:hypothetical protein
MVKLLVYFVDYIILSQTKASLISLFNQDILDIIDCCFNLALLVNKDETFQINIKF